MQNENEEQIIDDISELEVDCPYCGYMWSDDQYTCGHCYYEGGQGKLNVLKWVKDNIEQVKNYNQ